MQFTLRTATSSDLPQLLSLGLASYGIYKSQLEPVHWDTMQANLSNETLYQELISTAHSFVYERKNQILGMAFLVPSGHPTPVFEADWSYIRKMGVHPDATGQGIAKLLVETCINRASETGEATVALHTSEMMDKARQIYEKAGFRQQREINPIFGKKYWLYLLHLRQHHL
jgi:GNAT superfamily N-acetyltransferase